LSAYFSINKNQTFTNGGAVSKAGNRDSGAGKTEIIRFSAILRNEYGSHRVKRQKILKVTHYYMVIKSTMASTQISKLRIKLSQPLENLINLQTNGDYSKINKLECNARATKTKKPT
jgi:hypothetical protein